MSALPLAVVLHLAASCAPAVAPETLLSVVKTESSFDALAIGDNSTRRSFHPATLADAVALAAQLTAAGHSLDLGVAQINTAAGHLQRRGLPLSAAFDPCTGFRVGGQVLAECWARATGPDEQARLRAAIGCYNKGSPDAGTAYVERVRATAAQVVPAIRVAEADVAVPEPRRKEPPPTDLIQSGAGSERDPAPTTQRPPPEPRAAAAFLASGSGRNR